MNKQKKRIRLVKFKKILRKKGFFELTFQNDMKECVMGRPGGQAFQKESMTSARRTSAR